MHRHLGYVYGLNKYMDIVRASFVRATLIFSYIKSVMSTMHVWIFVLKGL